MTIQNFMAVSLHLTSRRLNGTHIMPHANELNSLHCSICLWHATHFNTLDNKSFPHNIVHNTYTVCVMYYVHAEWRRRLQQRANFKIGTYLPLVVFLKIHEVISLVICPLLVVAIKIIYQRFFN